MNPFSQNDWKKAAWKVTNHSEKAGPGWLIAGIILILGVIIFLRGQL
jgi:hypothetical protein